MAGFASFGMPMGNDNSAAAQKARKEGLARIALAKKSGYKSGGFIGGKSGPILESTSVGDFANRLGRYYTVDVGDATSRTIQDTFLGGKGKSNVLDYSLLKPDTGFGILDAAIKYNPTNLVAGNLLNNADFSQMLAPGDIVPVGKVASLGLKGVKASPNILKGIKMAAGRTSPDVLSAASGGLLRGSPVRAARGAPDEFDKIINAAKAKDPTLGDVAPEGTAPAPFRSEADWDESMSVNYNKAKQKIIYDLEDSIPIEKGDDFSLLTPIIDDSIAALDSEIGNLTMARYNHNDLEDFLGRVAAPDDYTVADSSLAKRADELVREIGNEATIFNANTEQWLFDNLFDKDVIKSADDILEGKIKKYLDETYGADDPITKDKDVVDWIKETRTSMMSEKQSDPSTWTNAERTAYDAGDWKTFSTLRGYTPDEIKQYEKYLALSERVSKKYEQDGTSLFDPDLEEFLGTVGVVKPVTKAADAVTPMRPAPLLPRLKKYEANRSNQQAIPGRYAEEAPDISGKTDNEKIKTIREFLNPDTKKINVNTGEVGSVVGQADLEIKYSDLVLRGRLSKRSRDYGKPYDFNPQTRANTIIVNREKEIGKQLSVENKARIKQEEINRNTTQLKELIEAVAVNFKDEYDEAYNLGGIPAVLDRFEVAHIGTLTSGSRVEWSNVRLVPKEIHAVQGTKPWSSMYTLLVKKEEETLGRKLTAAEKAVIKKKITLIR